MSIGRNLVVALSLFAGLAALTVPDAQAGRSRAT